MWVIITVCCSFKSHQHCSCVSSEVMIMWHIFRRDCNACCVNRNCNDAWEQVGFQRQLHITYNDYVVVCICDLKKSWWPCFFFVYRNCVDSDCCVFTSCVVCTQTSSSKGLNAVWNGERKRSDIDGGCPHFASADVATTTLSSCGETCVLTTPTTSSWWKNSWSSSHRTWVGLHSSVDGVLFEMCFYPAFIFAFINEVSRTIMCQILLHIERSMVQRACMHWQYISTLSMHTLTVHLNT